MARILNINIIRGFPTFAFSQRVLRPIQSRKQSVEMKYYDYQLSKARQSLVNRF